MVTQAPNVDPGQAAVVRIDAAALEAALVPSVSSGQVLPIALREYLSDSQALIFFRGQLVQADVPPNLPTGQRLLTSVNVQGDKILLQLVNQVPTDQLQAFEQLAKQLKEYLQSTGSNPLVPPQPFPVVLPETPNGEPTPTGLPNILEQLRNIIQSTDQLELPENTLSSLIASSKGNTAQSLHTTAESLRQLLRNIQESPTERVLNALGDDLVRLLQQALDDHQVVSKRLSQDVDVLNDVLKDPKKLQPNDRQLLRSILQDLQKAQTSPEEIRQALEQIQQKLGDLNNQSGSARTKIDSGLQSRLEEIASKLDQMASTQETLSRLNPIMQALGEPALILLPFVFQGLLAHSEVTVQPKPRRLSTDEESDGKSGGGKGGAYQRVQVSVPLPSLGNVDVDIAHRKDEIMVRFTVEDPEVADFLVEQLEHLAVLLKEGGFNRAELMANVGVKTDNRPDWSWTLNSGTTVIA